MLTFGAKHRPPQSHGRAWPQIKHMAMLVLIPALHTNHPEYYRSIFHVFKKHIKVQNAYNSLIFSYRILSYWGEVSPTNKPWWSRATKQTRDLVRSDTSCGSLRASKQLMRA